jgi:hypothetical protein
MLSLRILLSLFTAFGFAVSDSVAQLLDWNARPAHQNLLNDLRTTWHGLFGPFTPNNILARNIANMTGGTMICMLEHLAPPLVDGKQSSSSSSAQPGNQTTTRHASPSPTPSQPPPSIWNLFKSHVGFVLFNLQFGN